MNVLDLQGKHIVVTSYRGERKNRLALVVKVRDTQVEPIAYRQFRRNKMQRSRYLITVWDTVTCEFRSYYDKYVTYRKPGLFSALYDWWVTH